MSEFLLLHDNESEGKPAAVRKSIIQKDHLSLLNLTMEKL